MQSVLGNLVGICISVHSHLVQLFVRFIKSFFHQDNLAIFGLSTQFSTSQLSFILKNITKSFMYQSEFSIKPFRFSWMNLRKSSRVTSCWFVLLSSSPSIRMEDRRFVRFIRALSFIGQPTRARSIVRSGHRF